MHTFAQKQQPKQQARTPNSSTKSPPWSSQSQSVRSIFHLQPTIENQGVQRSPQSNAEEFEVGSTSKVSTRFGYDFSRIPIVSPSLVQVQPKLTVNTSGDLYEQEADRVAEHVMRMPDSIVQRQAEEEKPIQTKAISNAITPLVQRQPKPEEEEEVVPTSDVDELGEEEELAPFMESVPTRDAGELGEEEEEELIQAKSNTGATPKVTPGIAHDIQFLKGTGQPLSASERAFFEPRFGRDFGDVRVHTGSRAAHTAQAINARAFTLGHDVVFDVGQYLPGTRSSRRLLAHELTHVVQQSSGKNVRTKAQAGILTSHGGLVQRDHTGSSTERRLYLWNLRNIALTDALIRRTATYRYLRRILKANETEARIACHLWHNDLSGSSKLQRWKSRRTATSRAKLYLSMARSWKRGTISSEKIRKTKLQARYSKHLVKAYEAMRTSRGNIPKHIEMFCARVDKRYFNCYSGIRINVTRKVGGTEITRKEPRPTQFYIELKNRKSHTPASALRLLFKNIARWSFECAMAVQVANLYAKLQTFGDAWFNKKMKIAILISENQVTGEKKIKIVTKLLIAQDTSSSMERKVVYRRDVRNQPLERTLGTSRKFKKYTRRDSELLDEAPVGSRVVFNTDKKDVQNATKLGRDRYAIFGLLKTRTAFSKNEIELIMGYHALSHSKRRKCRQLAKKGVLCSDVKAMRKTVFVSRIIHYSLF